MPTSTEIVPIPQWAVPVGCTKFVLNIIFLGFTTACTVAWGGYPAFCFSLLTASTSLVVFTYYLAALSFNQRIHSKYLILALESNLTLLWFTSLILLSGWTDASTYFPYFTWRSTEPITPYSGISPQVHKDHARSAGSLHPMEVRKRNDALLFTSVRFHGQSEHEATRVLAGMSAGLAGIEFVLSVVTLAIFSINLIRMNDSESATTQETDIEARASSVTTFDGPLPASFARPDTSTSHYDSTAIGIARPMSSARSGLNCSNTDDRISELTDSYPLRFGDLDDVTNAGIEPPTPVMKVWIADKEREERKPGPESWHDESGHDERRVSVEVKPDSKVLEVARS